MCVLLKIPGSIKKKINFTYFIFKIILFCFHCAGSSLLPRLLLVVVSGGYSLVSLSGLLISVASLVACRLQ